MLINKISPPSYDNDLFQKKEDYYEFIVKNAKQNTFFE